MTTPNDLTITPRNLHFQADQAKDRAWLAGDPVGTAVFNALSLTFPDGERLFMDAVRAHRGELSGKLLADANAFITQEAIHSREHVGMNAAIDADHYPLAEIEDHLRQTLAEARERGPRHMLAATITLEHFTAILADQLLEGKDLLVGAPDELRRLWRWHAMEETEHKAVAFDVFRQISKTWKPYQRYALRALTMLATTRIFIGNITRYASMLLMADGMGAGEARRRVLWYLFAKPGLFRICGGAYLDWFRPGFHPWDHDNQSALDAAKLDFQPAMAAAAA